MEKDQRFLQETSSTDKSAKKKSSKEKSSRNNSSTDKSSKNDSSKYKSSNEGSSKSSSPNYNSSSTDNSVKKLSDDLVLKYLEENGFDEVRNDFINLLSSNNNG